MVRSVGRASERAMLVRRGRSDLAAAALWWYYARGMGGLQGRPRPSVPELLLLLLPFQDRPACRFQWRLQRNAAGLLNGQRSPPFAPRFQTTVQCVKAERGPDCGEGEAPPARVGGAALSNEGSEEGGEEGRNTVKIARRDVSSFCPNQTRPTPY